MKSMPARSAMRPSARQSGQLADQRSGTGVAVRDDEQFAPNTPILSALALYMAMRSRIDPVRVGNVRTLISRSRSASSPADFLHERRVSTTSGGPISGRRESHSYRSGFRGIVLNASIHADPAAIRENDHTMMKRHVSGVLAVAAIFVLASLVGRTALSQSAAPSIAEVDQAILAELALSHQILVNEGVLDAYGHVSIRHRKN